MVIRHLFSAKVATDTNYVYTHKKNRKKYIFFQKYLLKKKKLGLTVYIPWKDVWIGMVYK